MKTSHQAIYRQLTQAFSLPADDLYVIVDVEDQRLSLYRGRALLADWPVSTAANGTGCTVDSFCTPTGVHRIEQKIGEGESSGMVFRGRQPTGEIADIITQPVDTGLDLITTRILRLAGMEPGHNQGGDVDSYERYIYIHGTAEEGRLGRPVSHGCVRMANLDILSLFGQVTEGTLVVIV